MAPLKHSNSSGSSFFLLQYTVVHPSSLFAALQPHVHPYFSLMMQETSWTPWFSLPPLFPFHSSSSFFFSIFLSFLFFPFFLFFLFFFSSLPSSSFSLLVPLSPLYDAMPSLNKKVDGGNEKRLCRFSPSKILYTRRRRRKSFDRRRGVLRTENVEGIGEGRGWRRVTAVI